MSKTLFYHIKMWYSIAMSKPHIDKLLRKIVEKATAVGFTKYTLAKFADFHKNTFRHFGTPNWEPSIATIRKLEEVLSKPVSALREEAISKKIPLGTSRRPRQKSEKTQDAHPSP
jgi:hypothetical protein